MEEAVHTQAFQKDFFSYFHSPCSVPRPEISAPCTHKMNNPNFPGQPWQNPNAVDSRSMAYVPPQNRTMAYVPPQNSPMAQNNGGQVQMAGYGQVSDATLDWNSKVTISKLRAEPRQSFVQASPPQMPTQHPVVNPYPVQHAFPPSPAPTAYGVSRPNLNVNRLLLQELRIDTSS